MKIKKPKKYTTLKFNFAVCCPKHGNLFFEEDFDDDVFKLTVKTCPACINPLIEGFEVRIKAMETALQETLTGDLEKIFMAQYSMLLNVYGKSLTDEFKKCIMRTKIPINSEEK